MPAPDSGRTVPLTDEILSRILAAIPGLDKRTEAEIAGDVDRTRRLLRTATQGPGRPPAPEEPDNP
jgi:transposase